MKFGPVPVDASEGGVVAHAIRRDGLVLKKGEIVGAEHIRALREAGVAEITIAKLDSDDVGEDAAASALAERVAGEGVRIDPPFTGRANLFAKSAGVLLIDLEGLNEVNSVHEDVTVATLPNYRTVVLGEMVGTVKIIPFAVASRTLARAVRAAVRPILNVRPFLPLKVGVISTLLPGLKPSVVEKTLRVLATRLQPAGASVVREERVAHRADALAGAIETVAPLSDLVLVFGASAITDRRDVIPAAIEAAGGVVDHFGMPVDPGNLLLLAHMPGGKPILGAPGCARSPKENGFDWVLHRLLAGVPVGAADIRAMGAGGLLMEIVSRPQPRADSQVDVETVAERLAADE